jgi:MYXO-CTERM domain-containing protein
MSFRTLLCCTLATTLFAGCGQADDESELGVLTQPMFAGVPSDASYDGVVFLETKQTSESTLSCTGTLIAPNLVITALHCVTNAALEGYHFTCRPDGSLSSSDAQAGTLGALVLASNVKIYLGSPVQYNSREPAAIGKLLFGTGSSQACQGDLALVQLDRALEQPVASVRLDRMAAWKEKATVLGYGETETGNNGGLRRMRQVEVLDVGASSAVDSTRTASPRTFVVGEGPCKGDSGGPAFSDTTGALLGVFSLNTADSCDSVGTRNVYTALSPFSKLILDTFETAGAEPVLEPGSSLDEPEPKKKAEAGGCAVSPGRPAPQGFALALFGIGAIYLGRRRRA